MHKAKALVIACIDFRFHTKLHYFLSKEHLWGKCDLISVAGASRDLIKPVLPEDGEYLWKQLEISLKLHDPHEIILVDHQDCGGYAQDGTIPKGLLYSEDKNMHSVFLLQIKKIIKQKYHKECQTRYLSFDKSLPELL
jgi:carbonic anhydrase